MTQGEGLLGEAPGLPSEPAYALTLFVLGASERSTQAIRAVREVCQRHLGGSYSLEVVDIHQDQARMRESQVLAVPTLLRELPLPPRRLVGELTVERLCAVFDVATDGEESPGAH